jgi:hypothetical protein
MAARRADADLAADAPERDAGTDPGRIGARVNGVPATVYSPAPSRAEYHRRCRA